MSEKIVLLDGNSIMNRAFYGIPILTNSQGTYTNAVYGFLNIMLKILDEESPNYMIVAFDVKKPTFRHERYAEYKGTRKGMPEELKAQMPIIKEVLQAMNIKIIERAGYEADDILGTIARNSEKEGLAVSLVSGDRDLLQIATDRIQIRIPKTKRNGTEIEDYYTKYVIEKYGVEPLQIIDLKGLMGDAADNIPGVPSIGEKTATKIIKEFGSVENAIENIDKVMPNKARESLRENVDKAMLSKELATIKTDCELDYTLEEATIDDMFNEEAVKLFKQLEFKNLLSRIQCSDVLQKQLELEVINVDNLADSERIFADIIKQYSGALSNGVADLRKEGQAFKAIGLRLCNIDQQNLAFIAYEKDKVVCLKEEGFITFDYIIDKIKSLLDNKVMVVINDVKSQLSFLDKKDSEYISTVVNTDYIFDIALAGYLIKPLSDTYNYDDLAKDYSNIMLPSMKELIGKDKKQSQEVINEHMVQGYEYDAYVNFAFCENVVKELFNTSMMNLMLDIELPLAYTLYDMEKRGIKAKEDELKSYGERLQKRIEDLELLIYDLAGEQFNINSPKQLGVALFEDLALPCKKKTKSGYSTSADVLESLKNQHPVVSMVLQYRTLSKLNSTYCEGLLKVIGDDGRIHSSFNQTETRTGRISSTEPNLQNIPVRTELGREMRKFFTARDGWVLVDADYSQIELRVLADISGDKNMIDAFKNNQDIHAITASQVFNMPLDFVTGEMRSRAKAVNFGIVYGIGAYSLAKDIGVTNKEAKNYIESYLKHYRGIDKYMHDVVEKAKDTGYVETVFGRRRYLPELSASNGMTRAFGERVARNAPIQGTAADIIKIAMIKVDKRLAEENLEARLVLQVHDELIVECPSHESMRVAMILQEEMEKAVSLSVPLVADSAVGKTWYDAKG